MIKIELPFWFDGAEITALKDAVVLWWDQVETWLKWPATQVNVMTCVVPILYLIAFQRDIQRFKDEPLNLFRKRVKFALINAQDAGSKAGFIAIFERLGIGYVEIEERVDPVDWDVILLYVSDSQLVDNVDLFTQIIRQYGRTCRRYQLTILSTLTVTMPAFAVGHGYSYDVAEL